MTTETSRDLPQGGSSLKTRVRSFLARHWIPLSIAFSGLCLYSSLVLHRYIHLAYVDWDMAFYNQSIWNMLHGKLESSLFGFHPFGGHAEFIDLFVAPILAIFPHPLTYTFLEILLFLSASILLYTMAREEFNRKLPAAILMITFLIFPPNVFALCHDHNPEMLAPFFILLAVFAFRRKNLPLFYFNMIVLFLIKENMPLFVCILGMWGIFSKDRNRWHWGVVPLVLSIVYFLVTVKILIPHFRGMEQHSLWVRYGHIGKTPLEIIVNLMQFDVFKKVVLSPENINWLTALFGILLLPAIFSPSLLAPILPFLAYHLLSSRTQEKTIFYYYALAMTPMIFLATVRTLARICSSDISRLAFCSLLLLGSCLQLYVLRNELAGKIGISWNDELPGKWRMIRSIPPEAGVIATFEFLTPLSLREHLYSFHKVYDRHYHDAKTMAEHEFNVGKAFVAPNDVQYALIDYTDPWLSVLYERDRAYVEQKIKEFLDPSWEEIDSSGAVYLYQRKKAAGI